MMENKCNKTPNNNNSNGKYLDHVYCHSESKNYIRSNNNASSGNGGTGGGTTAAGADILALLKENKQLKSMLILHLDLIQEQSDQIMAKDKQLETLRAKNTQIEAQLQELQKQLQRQIKRAAAAAGELSSVPPPLAKIQCKMECKMEASPIPSSGTPIGECNGKLISKIILHRVNMGGREGTHSPNSSTTASSDTASDADEIKLHHEDDDETYGNTTEDSNDAHTKRLRRPRAAKTQTTTTTASTTATTPPLNIASRGAKPRRPITSSIPTTTVATTTAPPVQVCVTPPTPSRGKQMPLMLWHAPEMHSDESASCDSMADLEQRSTSATSPAPITGDAKKSQSSTLAPLAYCQHLHAHLHHAKSRRCTYISTPQMYSTREWEDEEFLCEYEFIKEEANALHADAPMLEIPKWTEHELTVSYCIEGTEDLSDGSFLKRHAKLEVDEKRRKKWDVQQIREQRRIEKLKRRHCKDEIQTAPDQQPLHSFYPQPDEIQTICFINDLPVQAFGEMIPKLSINAEFALPWLEATTSTVSGSTSSTSSSVATLTSGNFSASSAQAQQQMFNSSFVFLKKRKRQQSSSTGPPTARQRSVAASKAPQVTTAVTTPPTI